MARNTIIRQLREMGVSDWERRKFRELEKQLQAVKLYNKGHLAALVFRNKIELVKI